MWDLTIHRVSSLALVSFSNRCGTLQSTPVGDQCPYWHTTSCPTPSLVHRPVSNSDTICNSPSPLLGDIVLIEFSLSTSPRRFFKCARERLPHLYKECSVLLFNRCGISPSTPWGPVSLLAHHLMSTPFWDSTSSLSHHLVSSSDTICNC